MWSALAAPVPGRGRQVTRGRRRIVHTRAASLWGRGDSLRILFLCIAFGKKPFLARRRLPRAAAPPTQSSPVARRRRRRAAPCFRTCIIRNPSQNKPLPILRLVPCDLNFRKRGRSNWIYGAERLVFMDAQSYLLAIFALLCILECVARDHGRKQL